MARKNTDLDWEAFQKSKVLSTQPREAGDKDDQANYTPNPNPYFLTSKKPPINYSI